MAKNDLTLLDSILDDYCANGIPSTKPDEVFEFFTTEQVLKDYIFSREELLQGSVDGRNDGGIDEFYVIGPGVEYCVSDIRQSQEWHCRNRAEKGLNALLTSALEAQDGMRASA